MVKFGVKDVLRFWNESFLEKYDPEETSLKELRY